MYGLPKDLDLNFLKGREVGQVAIGVYEVIFAFDEDVTITAYNEFMFFDGQQEWSWISGPGAPQIAARTVSLLGATIERFKGQEDGTLSIVFSNGQRLTILDSSKEYESYTINRRDGSVIVV